jgi:HK97 family phage major capsid protein
MSDILTDTIREHQARINHLSAENDRIINSCPVEGKTLVMAPEKAVAFQANLAEITDLNGQVKMFRQQADLREYGSEAARGSVGMAAAAGASFDGASFDGGGYKNVGQAFTESKAYKDMLASGQFKTDVPFQMKGLDLTAQALSPRERKDIYTALPTGAGSGAGEIPGDFRGVVREAMVPRPYRKMRVRDLFPVVPTSAGIIEFFRVTGFTTNNASVVPERASGSFGAAPQTALTFESRQSIVRDIRHWEAVHRNTLADVANMQDVINGELLYGLRLVEDNQILYGTGTGEDLLGICNDPSVQTFDRAGGNTTDTNADDIRRAMTKAFLSNYEPTGCVVHPNDWEGIELLKNEDGNYLIALQVAIGAEQRLWRIPIVDTPAMTEGHFLVGSFGMGAKVYDRQEASIRVAEQHADFFVRSAAVVLAEQRLALTCPRPESFVYGDFGGPAS